MSYGSAQTRRSDAGRGGAPAMNATVAAATSSAAVSLPHMERIACSLRNCTEGEEVAKYYTRCRSGFAPAPGALHISRLRLVLPCDCLQPEHEQRAARVADVDVVTKAPIAPSAAVGSSGPMPSATPAPAQPPTPESTATYCLPSGPRYVIGLPMIPEGVLNFHSSVPVVASTALIQPSIVP